MYVKRFITNNIFGGINKNMETKNFYAFNPLFEDLFDFPFFDKAHHHQTMRTDIEENDTNYLLSIDVPGFKKEDIEISLDDGYLVVKAQIKKAPRENQNTYLRKERFFGTYTRSFYVGDFNLECIDAGLHDGVLYISIPKECCKKENKKFVQIK